MRLIFIGGGRFAMELYSWMKSTESLAPYRELCYVANSNSNIRLKYIGDIPDIKLEPTDRLILATGRTEFRQEAIQQLKHAKESFVQYIHPTALLNDNVKLGVGTIVFPFCIISNDTVVGNFAFLNGYSSIGHDCVIGENLVMSPYAAITGTCILGNNVTMGTHSTIIPFKKIGNFCKLSPGSVAMKDVPDGYTVIGNMGQMIKL
jgi:sugar O-acyltransferase (sialic acid O-acetyltransferase NeuD family)